MQKSIEANPTIRLPEQLLRLLQEQSTAAGMPADVYLEQLLYRAPADHQTESRRKAMARLMEKAKDGIYEVNGLLTREEAHDRDA